jgi:hypothetical protein
MTGGRAGAQDGRRRLGYVRLAEGRNADALVLFERNLATYEDLGADRHVAITLISCGPP